MLNNTRATQMNPSRTQNTDDGQSIYDELLETYEPRTAEGASLKIERYDEKEVITNDNHIPRQVPKLSAYLR